MIHQLNPFPDGSGQGGISSKDLVIGDKNGIIMAYYNVGRAVIDLVVEKSLRLDAVSNRRMLWVVFYFNFSPSLNALPTTSPMTR